MKKPKTESDQPIGIVIATGGLGGAASTSPRVRAYLWCEVDPSPLSQVEEQAILAK